MSDRQESFHPTQPPFGQLQPSLHGQGQPVSRPNQEVQLYGPGKAQQQFDSGRAISLPGDTRLPAASAQQSRAGRADISGETQAGAFYEKTTGTDLNEVKGNWSGGTAFQISGYVQDTVTNCPPVHNKVDSNTAVDSAKQINGRVILTQPNNMGMLLSQPTPQTQPPHQMPGRPPVPQYNAQSNPTGVPAPQTPINGQSPPNGSQHPNAKFGMPSPPGPQCGGTYYPR